MTDHLWAARLVACLAKKKAGSTARWLVAESAAHLVLYLAGEWVLPWGNFEAARKVCDLVERMAACSEGRSVVQLEYVMADLRVACWAFQTAVQKAA